MKMSTTLFALFLLSAFTSHLPFTTAQVIDTRGRPLQNGGVYYILSAASGRIGGIGQAATGNETCPLTVVLSSNSLGKQVRIQTPFILPALIGENVDVELSFTSIYVCAPTPKWTIVNGLPEGQSVKIVGYENTVPGYFRIRRYGFIGTYKLIFCASSSNICTDVGLYVDDEGVSRLVLTETNPLIVVFKNAGSSAAAASAA